MTIYVKTRVYVKLRLLKISPFIVLCICLGKRGCSYMTLVSKGKPSFPRLWYKASSSVLNIRIWEVTVWQNRVVTNEITNVVFLNVYIGGGQFPHTPLVMHYGLIVNEFNNSVTKQACIEACFTQGGRGSVWNGQTAPDATLG